MSTSRDHPPHNGRPPYEPRQLQFQEHHRHDGSGISGGGGRPHRDDGVRQQRRPRYNNDHRAHRSGVVQWAVAVVFTVLAVVVLLAAVAVLVVVLLLQPRSPYLAVRTASLDALVYDQNGALDDVQLSLLVEARNGNAHSAAEFSRLDLRLSFGGGTVLAVLRADPFQLPPKGTLPLAYVARSQGVPLDATRSAAVEAALRAGVVPFRVEGEAKTAWKMAGVVSINHWTRMGCDLRFFWPNGSALHFTCSSKSKFLF
jgi:hypothetical protein